MTIKQTRSSETCSHTDVDSIVRVRDQLANTALFACSLIGILAVAASLYRIVDIGWQNVMALHLFAYFTVLVSAIFHNRLPYLVKGNILVGLFFLLGCVALYNLGVFGNAAVFLIAASLIGAILFGPRYGIAVLGASLAVVTAIFLLTQQGIISSNIDNNARAMAPASWVLLTAVITLVTGTIIFCIARIHSVLLDTIQKLKIEAAQRDELEAQIFSSQQKIRAVLDIIPMTISLRDLDSRILIANKALGDLHQVHPKDLIGTTTQQLPRGTEEEKAIWIEQEKKVIETGESIETPQTLFTPAEGENYYLRMIKIPFRDEQGNVQGVVTSTENITEQVKAQEELVDRNRTIELLNSVAEAVQCAESVDSAYQGCLQQICDTLEWPIGHVYLLTNEESMELIPSKIWYIKEGAFFTTFREVTERTSFKPGEGLPGRVLKNGKPAWIVDVTKDSNFPRAKLAADIGVKSGLAFPVASDDGLIAVLEFYTTVAIEPNQKLLRSMATIGQQLGGMILRKKVEEALYKQERLLQAIFDTIPMGIFVKDTKGRYIMANKVMASVQGMTPEEFIKHKPSKLPRGTSEELGEIETEDIHVLKTGKVLHIPEAKFTQAAGEEKWVRRIKTPLIDESGGIYGLVGIREDITERKQAEDKVRNSERQFRELLDSSPIGVSITTSDDRLIYFNSRVLERTGYSAEELKNIHASDITKSSEERQKILEMAVRQEPIRDYEIELVRKDGTSWWSLMTVDQIDFEGQRGSLTWDFDISEQKAAEQEIERARDLAEAATQAKSSFLAAMSHEIRTPMNGVVGMIDLLQQTEMDTDQRQMVRTVRDSAFALLGIINDILDFSKIEAGKLELEIIPFSIRDVIEGVAQTLLPTSNKQDVRLLIYIDPEIPAWVMGDSVRLRQIIFNLAGNAIKFTESRNGEQGIVTLRADRVKSKSKYKVDLQFSVTDTGIGMSSEGVETIFKPFSQAESSTTRRFGGTGLGLSICKNLVDLMKGEIGVSSEEGKGSTFTVEVSLQPSNVERSDVEQTDLSGLRILLVIKQQATLEFTKHYLEHSRIDISSAEELGEVPDLLKDAKKAGNSFDILILGSYWDKEQREGLIASLRKDIKELRYLILTDDQAVKKGLVLPDTMVVQNSPLLRSAFIHGVGVVAGRASPDLAEDAPGFRLKARKALSVEEAEALGQLVLVAEDNLTNQDVIRRQLNLLGYTAEIAFDGKEAFELWKSKNYGLLLSDVHMPEMDGYELTAAIRKTEKDSDKRFPIIAITANALQGEADKCLQAGMDDYLAKPLEMDKLKRMLGKWLPQTKSGKTRLAKRTKKKGSESSTAGKSEDQKTTSIPPIDFLALTSVFGHDPDTIHEILRDFVGPATDNVKEIEEAYTNHTAEGVQTAAHKLKSSARSVGANELANSCLVLEQAGKESNWQELEREVPKLVGKLDDVLAYIKDF